MTHTGARRRGTTLKRLATSLWEALGGRPGRFTPLIRSINIACLALALIVAVAAFVCDNGNNGLFRSTGHAEFTEIYIEDGWLVAADWTPDPKWFEETDFHLLPTTWTWFSIPQSWMPKELLEDLWLPSGKVERWAPDTHLGAPLPIDVELVGGQGVGLNVKTLCVYSMYSLVWLTLQLACFPGLCVSWYWFRAIVVARTKS